MFDQASVWKSETPTQIPSLMARLRDSAGSGCEPEGPDRSDLWSPRAAASACCLLVVEIDGFAQALLENPALAIGLLDAVEARLLRNVRSDDTVAILGRGQFAIVLGTAAASEAGAFRAAGAILRSFDEPVVVEHMPVRVTASIGIATSTRWTSTGAMIGAALREVAEVKRNGGNGIKCATVCRARSSPAPRRYAILGNA